jgi:ubiquinone/menaquinone biosynthesis C-methylase UbiE
MRKYDKIASKYDKSWDGRMSAKFKQKIFEIAKLKDGDKVLDVGCGNGTLLNLLKQKADISPYGIDISPNMISQCKSKYPDYNFSVSSGEQLPFNDNTFDMVTTCCVLHHFDNANNFFKEAYRVLKPNGKIIVNDIKMPLILKPFFDYIFSPLYRAGDNKLFTAHKLKNLVTINGFVIKKFYKKGLMQIICATRI